MDISALLASFAAAFSQDQRLVTLQLGDGGRWGEMLLPLAVHAAANPVFAAVQSFDFALAGELPPRSYCLQYRESDFDFIVRLLHEEGLGWRFAHLNGDIPQVQLIAVDDPYTLTPARIRGHGVHLDVGYRRRVSGLPHPVRRTVRYLLV